MPPVGATPRATVLLLTFRQQAFVRPALLSLLDQDYPNLEILVLDDASPDRTLDIVREVLAEHPRSGCVRVMPAARNQGLAANWNRGVAAASGEILVAAAGDDVSHPGRVAAAAAYFAANPSVHALYFGCRIIDAAGSLRSAEWRPIAAPVTKTLGSGEMWKGFPFNGATAAYRAGCLRKFGPIDRRCGTEDVSSLMRAQMMGSAVVLPPVQVDWRWHGANLSHGGVAGSVERTARLRAKLRKAKGAYHDGAQLERDAHRAVELGLRPAGQVAGLVAAARKMQATARLKYHALHPGSRWTVFAHLAGQVWRSSHFSLVERVALTAKCFARRALPGAVRQWGA